MIRQVALLGLAVLSVSAVGCGGSSSPSASGAGSSSSGSGASSSSSGSTAQPAPPTWPAPPDPLRLAVAAGLKPEPAETLIHHVHSHLDVFVNGAAVRVPAGVGINIHDPAVHSFPLADGSTAYGGISPPCAQPCISPLHTHDDSGILHTESPSPVPNRLGQFFIEWDVRLTPSCVGSYCRPTSIKVYVDGQPFAGDPRTIQLTNHKEIAIVIGTPPKTIPAAASFANL